MSRIGNAPVAVPKEATVTVEGSDVVVKGPKGELRVSVPADFSAKVAGSVLTVSPKSTATKALHGYLRATIANAVTGVTRGFSKTLELSGVGYRASVSGTNLVLTVGFSHPVTIVPPGGITFAVNEGKIVIAGIDRQMVGQVAAQVRAVKKPEPYKGKGIKYEGEYIRKKAGKAKAVGGAPGATK